MNLSNDALEQAIKYVAQQAACILWGLPSNTDIHINRVERIDSLSWHVSYDHPADGVEEDVIVEKKENTLEATYRGHNIFSYHFPR